MERLTTRNEMGIAVLKEPYDCKCCGHLVWHLDDYGNGEPVSRLAAYEETGFMPEEVRKGEWIPVEERLPETDDYILLSFDNYSIPDIGRYETDGDGGAFYPGDDDRSCVSYGLFVNAWQPLPASYRGEESNYEDLKEQRQEKLLKKIREVAFERYGNGDGMGGQLVVDLDDIVELINSIGKNV